MDKSRVFILGALDPEMERIESLLTECGQQVVYATRGGARVVPATAYEADGTEPPIPAGADVVLVECGGPAFDQARVAARCDHHRPGDRGFDKSPAEFMAGSSLGQVTAILAQEGIVQSRGVARGMSSTGDDLDYRLRAKPWEEVPTLDLEPLAPGQFALSLYGWTVGGAGDIVPGRGLLVPCNLVLAAAADHCPGAAYRGECPGVDPDALGKWRATTRAAFQKRPVADILRDVEQARALLRTAPQVTLRDGRCPPACAGTHEEHRCASQAWEELHQEGRAVRVADMRGPFVAHAVGHISQRSLESPGLEYQNCPECACGIWDHKELDVVPELPEAALREGMAYIAGPIVGPDGRSKITLGAASPEQVRAFTEDWAPAQGLERIYGVAERGYAGGHIPALVVGGLALHAKHQGAVQALEAFCSRNAAILAQYEELKAAASPLECCLADDCPAAFQPEPGASTHPEGWVEVGTTCGCGGSGMFLCPEHVGQEEEERGRCASCSR